MKKSFFVKKLKDVKERKEGETCWKFSAFLIDEFNEDKLILVSEKQIDLKPSDEIIFQKVNFQKSLHKGEE